MPGGNFEGSPMNMCQNQLKLVQRQLTAMNQRADFELAVLADQQGLPIAWACRDAQIPEHYSAAVALLNQTLDQIRTRLVWPKIDEIALADERGRRLICRTLTIDHQDMSLVVLVRKRRSYRRAMNQTIRAICSLLSQVLP